MKVAQKPDHVRLTTLVGRLRESRFVIPDLQREFEWKTRDIRELVRSIFLDYKIGSLLLWKGKADSFSALVCEFNYGHHGYGDPVHVVLDGQQRLTAMHCVLVAPDEPLPNRTNRYLYFIHIDRFMDEIYDKAFMYDWTRRGVNLLADSIAQFEKHLFPVSVVGQGGWELPNWVDGYEMYWSDKEKAGQTDGDEAATNDADRLARDARAFGQHLKAITEQYQVSYVELDRDFEIHKNSLYDSYRMAIHWASDLIGERGFVAFVANGYWLYGSVNSGARACLTEGLTSIYVLNLRGNARRSGSRRRSDCDNEFGHGSRAPVAITTLVRNPGEEHHGCRILYRDIGDYLNCDNELAMLRNWSSIAVVADWDEIEPDLHNYWIGKRDEAFRALYPMGSKDTKAARTDEPIFRLISNGCKTDRDAYLYSFSEDTCAENAGNMADNCYDAMEEWEKTQQKWAENPESQSELGSFVDDITQRHSSNLRWNSEPKCRLRRQEPVGNSQDKLWSAQNRHFAKQHCRVDHPFAPRKYQLDSILPEGDNNSRAMRLADDDGTALTVNDHVRLVDIPPATHEFQINGRTRLEWLIDRCRIVRDRRSGILNDPNAWFNDPRELIAAFRGIVHVSVEASRIVANLPSPFRDSEREPAGVHR